MKKINSQYLRVLSVLVIPSIGLYYTLPMERVFPISFEIRFIFAVVLQTISIFSITTLIMRNRTNIKSLFRSKRHPNLSDMTMRLAEIAGEQFLSLQIGYTKYSKRSGSSTKIIIKGYIEDLGWVEGKDINEVCNKLLDLKNKPAEVNLVDDVKIDL